MSCRAQVTKKYCCSSRSCLPAGRLVVRVEDLRDVLGRGLLLDGAVVLALVERLEVEGLRGLRAPQPQHVRGVHAVAEDRRVVGDALHDAVGQPRDAQPSLGVRRGLGAAAEEHRERDLGPRDLPRVPEPQPVVRRLHLPAVADRLVEDAVLVADAVARSRGSRGSRASRGSTRRGGRGRRCRAPAPPPARSPRRGCSSISASACRTSFSTPRFSRLFARCGPSRNSAER